MSSRPDNNSFISKDNFLFFAILVFVFISTSALALNKKTFKIIEERLPIHAEENAKDFAPLPKLTTDYFPIISGQGAIAIDLNSGVMLYEKDSEKKLLPASTTKIVTALTALDYFSMEQVLKVPDINVVGQKMGLYPGEELRFEDLLYGMLVYSANDAAEVIAYNYCAPYLFPDYSQKCGREEFIQAMNDKARLLSMTNSNFVNPAGLDGSQQVTTAKDLIRVAEVAMQNPAFAKIVGTKEITVTDTTGKSQHKLRNINELLGEVPGVLGVKTGWTENARENLVTYVERDGRRVMIAVLGSQDRFGETKELIDWIFSSYSWESVVPQ